jgi:hypothetical protein
VEHKVTTIKVKGKNLYFTEKSSSVHGWIFGSLEDGNVAFDTKEQLQYVIDNTIGFTDPFHLTSIRKSDLEIVVLTLKT